MFRRLLNLGLLGLIFLLSSTNVYAQSDINPFESFDKSHEERLKTAKDIPNDQTFTQKPQTLEELHKIENNILESSENRYIVKFKEESSMQSIYDIVKLYNYEILGKSDNRLFVLDLNDKQSFEMQSKDIIEFMEKDTKKKSNIVPSDSYYSYQWAIPTINIPEAWEISKGDNSVYVAVIDSGIYRNHPDLVNADIRNGWDYLFHEYSDWDSVGHGTNVTGIIGAETNNSKGIAGVNWHVAIIPLRVISSNGEGYVSDTIDAIYDAADLGCDVINISLGSTEYSHAENHAVSYATSKGCIVVASAGNDGNKQHNYPASYEGVISVGSVDINLQVSSFSQHNNKIDVVAPGENIFTTAGWLKNPYYSDYLYVSGTSFSAPYVSGIAALASAVKPSITAHEFMEILEITSTDLGPTGYDNYYGYGLINAEKILQSVSTIKVKSISLNKSSITLKVGDSKTLTAIISPSNASNKNVTWKSKNPSVATVKNGTIKAVDSGTTIITVTTQDGGKKASVEVEVKSNSIEYQPITWDLFEDVDIDKIWNVEFNMELDENSWKNNIYIVDSVNNKHPVNISKKKDGKTLSVTPNYNYDYNTLYTMIINDTILSENGAKMNKKVYVPFQTEENSLNYEELSLSIVQDGYFHSHPYPSVQEAFENFFGHPSWNYFYSDDGFHVVEFKGTVYNYGILCTMTMQFTVDISNGSFEVNYAAFDNNPLYYYEFDYLLDAVYDYYFDLREDLDIEDIFIEDTDDSSINQKKDLKKKEQI